MLPRLFAVGPVTVYSYGVFLALAFVTAIAWSSRLARRDGIADAARVEGLGLVIVVTALLGSKLLHGLVYWGYYSAGWGQFLREQAVGRGGVFYGGFLLAVASSAVYIRLTGLPGWPLADCVAPGLAFAQGLGRIGCFLAGCCWGTPTTLPLGVTFTQPLAHQITGVPLHVRLHPTQLYEAALVLLAAALAAALRKKKSFPGQVMLAYVLFYAVARFFLEFLRGDPRGWILGGLLSTSQFISLLVVAGTCLLLVHYSRRRLAGRGQAVGAAGGGRPGASSRAARRVS